MRLKRPSDIATTRQRDDKSAIRKLNRSVGEPSIIRRCGRKRPDRRLDRRRLCGVGASRTQIHAGNVNLSDSERCVAYPADYRRSGWRAASGQNRADQRLRPTAGLEFLGIRFLAEVSGGSQICLALGSESGPDLYQIFERPDLAGTPGALASVNVHEKGDSETTRRDPRPQEFGR